MIRYLFMLLLMLPMTLLAEARVTIVADPWCPYNCEDTASKPGYMIDITRQALALYGLKIDYVNVNWARAKIMIQTGVRDGIVGMSKSTKSENLYIFPETAMGLSEACFFSRADSDWQFSGISSLDGQKFGWINDYGYGFYPQLDDWIQQQKNTSNVVVVAGESKIYERIIKMLLAGRITTFVDDNAVIKHHLKLLGYQDRIKTAGCLVESRANVYVAFSKETKNGQIYADAIDAGMATLKSEHQLESILLMYGLEPSDMGL